MTMKQQVVESGGGPDYDWANDHIFVKTTCDHADGRVAVVEDTLKPGFHLARHYHKTTTLRTLVEAGAYVSVTDRQGVSALAHARARGYAEIVSILEKAGER